MADKTVEDYLRSWGLEAYIEKFKEQAIDRRGSLRNSLELFTYARTPDRDIISGGCHARSVVYATRRKDSASLLVLSQEDIKELIPTVGHRALFIAHTNAFKEAINAPVINVPATEDVQTLDRIAIPDFNDVSSLDNITVETLEDQISKDLHNHLQSINEGRALLMQFQSKGLLDNSARRRLCNIIINKELQGNPDKVITSKCFYELAFQITKVFTKESAAVYFTPYVCFRSTQKTAAKGKLLDTYRQRRKEFAKSGLIAARKRRTSSSSSCSAPASASPQSSRVDDAVQKLPDEQDENLEDYMLWLKNSCDPWMTVQLYWNLTRKLRFQKYAEVGMSIADYFNDYRALGQSSGLYLLLDDFNSLYPDCKDRLYENWPLYRDHIIEIGKKRNDPELGNIISSCNGFTDEDVLNTVAFLCLPYLMNTSTLRKPKTQKQWRPSKIESQQGFIMHITSSADLQASITLCKEKMANLGFTVQPYIVIIGPSLNQIHTRYIIVNDVKYSATTDIRYNSTSIIQAVDSCFKILFVINAEYPSESAYVWTFIQKAMYKLSTKYDKVFTTVNALLTVLGISS